MEFVELSSVTAREWDAVVEHSDDGWMFSRYSWLKVLDSVPKWEFENYHFGVRQDGRWVGVMPLHLCPNGWLASGGMGMGGPTVIDHVPESFREKIVRQMLARAMDIGKATKALGLQVTICPLNTRSLRSPWGVNELVDHGFRDVSTHSWIVDLRGGRNDVFAGISRNARRKIDEAHKKGYTVRAIADRGEIDRYYEIHCETYTRTGVTPHPKEYFLAIYDYFTRPGHTDCWVAVNPDGEAVGFTNIARFGKTSSYWTACCRTADFENGVYYLLVHRAMEAAIARGDEWFDCAEAFPNAEVGSKLRALSDFKQKFGGQLHRYFKGEIILRDQGPSDKVVFLNGLAAAGNWAARAAGKRGGRRGEGLIRVFLHYGYEGARSAVSAVREVRRTIATRVHPPVRFLKPDWDEAERAIRTAGEDACQSFAEAFARQAGFGPDAAVVLTGSGRTALELALTVLCTKAPDRTKVIIPSYGCRGTFDPVVRAGLVPVFADMDHDLLSPDDELARHFGPDVLAVLLVHLTGKTKDVRQITPQARSRGIFVIEDHCQNAHPGLVDPSAPPADANIFSFGMGKTIMASAGGAAVTTFFNEDFDRERLNLRPEEPGLASRRFEHFCRTLFTSRRSAAPVLTDEFMGYGRVRMSPLDAGILIHQLAKWDRIVAARTRNAERIRGALARFPGIFRVQSPQNHIYTKLSVQLKDREGLRTFRGFMKARGIELEGMYLPLHLREFGTRYRTEPLETCEAIWARVINIPVRPNLQERELARIVAAVEHFGAHHG